MLLPYLSSRVVFPLAEKLSVRDVRSRVRAINRDLATPWVEREQRNRLRLAQIVQWAQHEIPFYRDLFSRLRFDPVKILRDIRYLNNIPVLTKADLLEAGDRIVHPDAKLHLNMQMSRTNGSTGASLPVYFSPAAKDESAAVTRISQEWVGFGPSDQQLHISSELPGEVPRGALREEWWRRAATNRISVECASWSDENLQALWKSIERHQPFLVQGHPSTLFHLANFVKDRNLPAKGKFKVFVSTGERLGDGHRATIEKVFGCRVANRYGNAEFGIVAHERFFPPADETGTDSDVSPADATARHYLQIMDPCVWVETLPSTSGVSGPLVVTSLVNYAAPLIRYATGDESRVIKGRAGVYLEGVEGRVHDVVLINGVRYSTSFVQDVLSRHMLVTDFQFVRSGGESLELRLALHNPRDEAAVRGHVEQIFGPGAVALGFVSRSQFIRVGRQQKFRYVVDV
ncbi:phenylacetate--CoA ligase family protein [Rhodopseudomonas telluris]|uniref:Phenylacetate--CoA ligase family protein n=1 Tax=Rhodopseudomonas telluris TaxID=644215 RepID=A0ABV6EN93_9BRAD